MKISNFVLSLLILNLGLNNTQVQPIGDDVKEGLIIGGSLIGSVLVLATLLSIAVGMGSRKSYGPGYLEQLMKEFKQTKLKANTQDINQATNDLEVLLNINGINPEYAEDFQGFIDSALTIKKLGPDSKNLTNFKNQVNKLAQNVGRNGDVLLNGILGIGKVNGDEFFKPATKYEFIKQFQITEPGVVDSVITQLTLIDPNTFLDNLPDFLKKYIAQNHEYQKSLINRLTQERFEPETIKNIANKLGIKFNPDPMPGMDPLPEAPGGPGALQNAPEVISPALEPAAAPVGQAQQASNLEFDTALNLPNPPGGLGETEVFKPGLFGE